MSPNNPICQIKSNQIKTIYSPQAIYIYNYLTKYQRWIESKNTLVHWYTGTLVHWCTGILVHWCTTLVHCVPVYQCTSTLHWYTGTLVHYPSTLHWYITLVHWCTTLIHWYTGTVHWYTGVLVHWYTGTLVHCIPVYCNSLAVYQCSAQVDQCCVPM